MSIRKHINYSVELFTFFINVLVPAMQIQLVLALGFFFSLLVSLFYLFVNDHRYPTENPSLLIAGLGMSFSCFLIGHVFKKSFHISPYVNLRRGAWIVFFTWLIACTISAVVYVLGGFPEPHHVAQYSLFRRFTDGWFESMSGFTTTGSSILPSVEVFPRGLLMWRAVTHWIGGMGIAFLAVTLWTRFSATRQEIINSEAESPNLVRFKNEVEARLSGIYFLKPYIVVTLIIIAALFISGMLFREVPYQKWYDNVYDSINYTFSVMGTGGLAPSDQSVGAPLIEHGKTVIGGLRNPVSEWILTVAMIACGANFSLWYMFFFQKRLGVFFKNKEFMTYLSFIVVLSICITVYLAIYHTNPTLLDNIRVAFFNVASITSTTGFGDQDYVLWPTQALSLLFLAHLVGACVGSTGGALKFTRVIVVFKYLKLTIEEILYNVGKETIELDGIIYTKHEAAAMTLNVVLYYLLFLLGGVVLTLTSSVLHFADGSTKNLDLLSAIGAAIENLGNTGASSVFGVLDISPLGNHYAFSEMGKWVLIGLMYIGRVGIFTFLSLFLTKHGEHYINQAMPSITFDKNTPRVKR